MKLINKIAMNIVNNQLDNDLYFAKSKETIKRRIHKKIENLIKGIFHDTAWQHVNIVFDAIREMGIDLNVEVRNGGYYNHDDGNIGGKVYNFDFQIINFENKKFEFKGQLTCDFCGTIDDPMSAYDMAFYFY